MALTRDFKVKDSLSVGISGLFRAGETSYNANKVAIDTYGRILSGGRDLATAFANITLSTLSQGSGIVTFSYNGGSPATVAVLGASGLTTGSLVQWTGSGTGFGNSTLTDTALVSLRTTTNTFSGKWESSYTSLNSLSSKWDSNYTSTNTLSSKWDSNYTSTNTLSNKWDSNYTTVNTNSANWNTAYNQGTSVYTTTNTLSSKWENTYTVTSTNSANWNTGYVLGSSAYTTTNTLSNKWNSDYTTVNTNSANWNTGYVLGSSAYSTTNTLSNKWDSNYTTTNTNSASWNSVYTTTNTNSASWGSVYSTYNAASGTILNNINVTAVQGQISATELDGGTITRLLTNLGTSGTPTFAGLTVTGGLSAVSLSGDGSGLTNVIATPTFPGLAATITDLASSNFFFVNDNATGAVSGNKRITYSSLLTDLVGNNTGLAVAADSDGIVFKNLAGLTGGTLTYWDGSNGQLANSTLTQNGTVLSASGGLGVVGAVVVDGTLIAKGDIVLGDTAADTLTINAGPVNFPNATAAGDALVFGTDANLYRSASGVLRTDNSLVVNTNLTVNGDITLGDTNTDTLTINAGPINFPNATGTADALILGTDASLYRSAISTLRTNSSLVVDGNTTITGNLSVLGDVTQINTLVSVTSALSVINAGTGPAIYVEQSGPQPIAQFVDNGGTAITFTDAGSVGIGLPVFAGNAVPAEKLTVSGNISAKDTLKLGGLAAGTTNSVVIESSGTLQNRAINPNVWDTAASFISGAAPRTTNTIPKFGTNTNGITNSTITDNGTDVTIGGNVIITPTHRIKHYAESGDTTLFIHTAVFSKGLSGTGTITVVPTFEKTDLKSSKYSVTLFQGANRTAFEILAVYDGVSTAEGTVYAIVDAQGTSLLTNADIAVGTSTIDLAITTSQPCSAFIKGEAYVDDNT